MATSAVNLDVTQYVRINAGLNPLILQAHRDSVRIVFSDVKPARSNTAFHVLGEKDGPYGPVEINTNVWALATSDNSSLMVTEDGSNDRSQRTAFGELSTAEPVPIMQITAPYGLLQKAQSFTVLGGTTAANNSLFEATTGTDPNALSALLSRRQVTYRAGQGLMARLTAIFDTPQPNSAQEAGLIINTDRLGFGFQGTSFGIIYQHDGESEIQELTLTVAAAGAENATVTINGTPFTVPLTAGTLQHNAFEIANSLEAQVPDYSFSSNDVTVVARSLIATPGTTFAFTSATAVGAWVQIEAGRIPTSDFVPQADWNVDTRPDLDPAKGNVYQVRMQYLGFGGIEFYVEDRETARLILVHRIRFANTSTTTSVGNPTFRVGWLVANTGNTTSLTIKGGSAAGFIEGKAIRTEPPRAAEVSNSAVPVGSLINMFSFRNRLVFGKRRNRVEVFGLSLTAATDSNKSATIKILANAVIAGDLDWQYRDKVSSVIEIAEDAGAVIGGTLVASFTVPSLGGVTVDLEQLLATAFPGDVITIASEVNAAAPALVGISVIWQEDI